MREREGAGIFALTPAPKRRSLTSSLTYTSLYRFERLLESPTLIVHASCGCGPVGRFLTSAALAFPGVQR